MYGHIYYFPGASTGSHKSSSTGIIAGAAAGGSALLLLLILAGLYAYRQKRRAERADKQNNPFGKIGNNLKFYFLFLSSFMLTI